MGRDELDAVRTPDGPPARGRRRFGASRADGGQRRYVPSTGARLHSPERSGVRFDGFDRVANDVGYQRGRSNGDWADPGQDFDFSGQVRPARASGTRVTPGLTFAAGDQHLKKQFIPPKQQDGFLSNIATKSAAAKRHGAKRVPVTPSSAGSLEMASAPSPSVPMRPLVSQSTQKYNSTRLVGSSGWTNTRKEPEKTARQSQPRVSLAQVSALQQQQSPSARAHRPSHYFADSSARTRRLKEYAPTNLQATFSLRSGGGQSESSVPSRPQRMSTRAKSKATVIGASADQPIALDDSESDDDGTPPAPASAPQSVEVDVDQVSGASATDKGKPAFADIFRVPHCDVLFGLFQCTATLLFQNDRVCVSEIRANHEKWPFQSSYVIKFGDLLGVGVCWDADGDDDKDDSPSFISVGDNLPFVALQCPTPDPENEAAWHSFYDPSDECEDLAKKVIIFKPSDAAAAKENVKGIVDIVRSYFDVQEIEKDQSRQFLRALEGEPFSFRKSKQQKSSRKRKKPGTDEAAAGSDDDSDSDEVVLTYPLPPCSSDIVTLIRRDVNRLKPERYLNDNVIDYYFRRLMVDTFRDEPAIQQRVLFLSSHFYSHFRMGRGSNVTSRLEAGYKNVSKWVARVDFFSRSMIFIPINKDWHWSLAVILNPWCAAIEAGEDEEESPCSCIAVLDPLGSYHNRKIIARNLRVFLRLEWQNSVGGGAGEASKGEVEAPPYDVDRVRTVVVDTPIQENGYDCGVYVLKFAEAMLENCLKGRLLERPDGAVNREIVDGKLEKLLPRDAFAQQDADETRRSVRRCIESDAGRFIALQEAKRRERGVAEAADPK